ncbi:threonine aldolase family protein [Roseitranquillus sediminis]|uniref:threonine aldolase family protein n=1 Tax=Roseitranquillus sediminis TaxID=2809051 RepID=UPI001D0CC4CA|nr:beta-eliminating lyase-related protein [Roseitranquillus sediminis]MBM9594949.1 low specificity L-threonine aldolase [Roseitranquillus sediminis]
MNFASDNTGPAHPRVMEALMRANEGRATSYGADALMEEVRTLVREAFEAPEAAVYLVATGTAANSLILATLAQPWQAIFCSEVAHIHEDECNAPEFYTGGAKLTIVPHEAGMMDPDALARAYEAEESRGVHGPQRGPVSITQVSEKGGVHTLDHLRALTGVARRFGQPVHMDGARFANALVALGCSPAEMTWKAGVDAVSLGGTKNGLLGVEAVVFFDPAHAWQFELRRKRAGHLFSKHRYLSAQMAAYLQDDLWIEMAQAANAAAARLVRGLKQRPDVTLAHDPRANIVFADWPRAAHRRLQEAGATYYIWNGGLEGPDDEALTARLVTDWSMPHADIDRFLDLMSG